MRKHMLRFVLVGALVSCCHCAAVKQWFGASVDAEEGSVTLAGLREPVTVSRDRLGVPYIAASNEDDLFFATGYVTASERLYQMVSLSLLGQGRIAEMAGEDFLQFDRFLRSLGMAAVVRRSMETMDPAMRRVLESYAAGVNAWIASHKRLPAEFGLTGYRPEPWRPEDTMYIFGMVNLGLSVNMLQELDYLILARRLGPERAAWLLPVQPDEPLPFAEAAKLPVLPAGAFPGDIAYRRLRERMAQRFLPGLPASNNFAIAGWRTRSGRAILENDTHLEITMPNTWFMMHQRCPGIDVAGVVIPGVPVVNIGFNGTIAWGVTMVMADSQDIFIERLKKNGDGFLYEYQGAWRPVSARREVFKIKGRDPVAETVYATHHGPLLNAALQQEPFPSKQAVGLIPFSSTHGIALAWALEGGAETLRGFYDLARARTMGAARAAIARIGAIYLNFLYSDGTAIAWQVSGIFPKRRSGRGHLPSPGWTGAYDWTGWEPFESLPHAENPASGFLATANNRTVPPGYPVVISSSWFGPGRVDRLNELLSSRRDFDREGARRVQLDRRSNTVRALQRLFFEGPAASRLAAAVEALPPSRRDRARRALAMLAPGSFDAVMDPRSAPAAVAGAFTRTVTRETFGDELGLDSPAFECIVDQSLLGYGAALDHLLGREDSPFWDRVGTPVREGKWDIIADALAGAVAYCEDTMGASPDRWQWGALHTYRFTHEFTKSTAFLHGYFNRGPYPAGGDNDTVNVASSGWGKNFDVFMIPAMRFLVDFGEKEPAQLVSVPGNSGNPSSPHYDDMIPYFLSGENHPLPFGEAAVKAHYTRHRTLMPPAR